jgi:hypothetical protein
MAKNTELVHIDNKQNGLFDFIPTKDTVSDCLTQLGTHYDGN